MMKPDKRKFLKIAGLTLAGIGAQPAAVALAQMAGKKYQRNENALPGTRWAMVFDSGKCEEDCRDCVHACHSLHNVPDFVTNPDPEVNNPRHEIKWIWTEQFANTFPGQESEYLRESFHHRDFIVMCNHCDNPPCVRVCPTQATWKRKSDGIVMMDYHRCIGCRFCMAACPYGSRSFNYRDPRVALDPDELNKKFPTRMKGVVEKCNFCAERLAVGLKPACVDACKSGALSFGDLANENDPVRKLLAEHYTLRRKPELGTMPMVYYIVS